MCPSDNENCNPNISVDNATKYSNYQRVYENEINIPINDLENNKKYNVYIYFTNDNNLSKALYITSHTITVKKDDKPKFELQATIGNSDETYEEGTLVNKSVRIEPISTNSSVSISKYQYKSIDSDEWKDLPTDSIKIFANMDDTIEFKAISYNGVESEIKSIQIYSDTKAPTIKSVTAKTKKNGQIVDYMYGTLSNEIIQVSIDAEDETSGIKCVQYKETDSEEWKTFGVNCKSRSMDFKDTNISIQIRVEDEAGNQTIYDKTLNIKSNTQDPTINEYKITDDLVNTDDNHKFVINVDPDTTVDKFKTEFNKLNIGNIDNVEVTEAINNPGYVGTGSTFEVNEITYTVIIAGDVNGDGKVDFYDIMRTIDIAYKDKTKDIYWHAGNINEEHKLNLNNNNQFNFYTIMRIIYMVYGG